MGMESFGQNDHGRTIGAERRLVGFRINARSPAAEDGHAVLGEEYGRFLRPFAAFYRGSARSYDGGSGVLEQRLISVEEKYRWGLIAKGLQQKGGICRFEAGPVLNLVFFRQPQQVIRPFYIRWAAGRECSGYARITLSASG